MCLFRRRQSSRSWFRRLLSGFVDCCLLPRSVDVGVTTTVYRPCRVPVHFLCGSCAAVVPLNGSPTQHCTGTGTKPNAEPPIGAENHVPQPHSRRELTFPPRRRRLPARALMQFAKDSRDLLMLAPCRSCSPRLFVADARSELPNEQKGNAPIRRRQNPQLRRNQPILVARADGEGKYDATTSKVKRCPLYSIERHK